MNSYRYNDKEALNMVLEFEVKNDGGRTDDSDEEDEGEIEDATCIIKRRTYSGFKELLIWVPYLWKIENFRELKNVPAYTFKVLKKKGMS